MKKNNYYSNILLDRLVELAGKKEVEVIFNKHKFSGPLRSDFKAGRKYISYEKFIQIVSELWDVVQGKIDRGIYTPLKIHEYFNINPGKGITILTIANLVFIQDSNSKYFMDDKNEIFEKNTFIINQIRELIRERN